MNKTVRALVYTTVYFLSISFFVMGVMLLFGNLSAGSLCSLSDAECAGYMYYSIAIPFSGTRLPMHVFSGVALILSAFVFLTFSLLTMKVITRKVVAE